VFTTNIRISLQDSKKCEYTGHVVNHSCRQTQTSPFLV